MTTMLSPRSLFEDYESPPLPRSRLQNNPSLLYSWWCTCFAIVIIIFRLGGRYVRSERWFREDGIMALAIIPCLIRMGFVHVILLYGTNNAAQPEIFDDDELRKRSIGSGLVIAARIFYALFIWISKYTITEFLARMTATFWKSQYGIALKIIRYSIIVSFIGVVISTLAECQPFDHYWQVSPDPGPACRSAFGQLVTMGVLDIITDLMLLIYPIPVVAQAAIPGYRKFKLMLLFGLSGILVGVAGARMPYVIRAHGSQQYRTVWASTEILVAAGVSNAVILGSFLRDRGVKKRKFKFGSTSDSIESHSMRRPTLQKRQWGSDEDLIRTMGIRLDPSFYDAPPAPRPAPMAAPASPRTPGNMPTFVDKHWHFPGHDSCRESEDSDLKNAIPGDGAVSPGHVPRSSRRVSFFDVGGLLEDGRSITSTTPIIQQTEEVPESSRGRSMRTTSRNILSDLGGLITPSRSPHTSHVSRHRHAISNDGAIELSLRTPKTPKQPTTDSPPTGVLGPQLKRETTLQSLQDVGGLLGGQLPDRRPATSGSIVSQDPPQLPPLDPLSPTGLPPPRFPRTGLPATSVPASRSTSRPRPGLSRHETPPTGVPSPQLKSRGRSGSLQDVGGLLSDV